MSDLQHEYDSREGSQEREDAGEDGAASGFVSSSRPAAAAPATERAAAADSSRKRRREAAQGASRATSPARSRSRTNLAGAFALGGWSRRPSAASAARLRRASGRPVSGGQPAASAAKDTSARPAVDDDALQDAFDVIDDGELDQDDEPAAGTAAAPACSATSTIGGSVRSSGATARAAAGPYTSMLKSIRRTTLSRSRPRPSGSSSAVRVGDIPLVMERQREYKARSAEAKDLHSQGSAEGLLPGHLLRLIGRCRSPQGGGTGPGRVRTGRA